jgi:hypothetical protein
MVAISFSNISTADIAYQLAHYEENRSHIITVVTTVFFVFALISVALRFVTKRVKRLSHRVDDYLIAVALVSISSRSLGLHAN